VSEGEDTGGARFAGERVVVIGTGASGRAAARVLVAEGAEVWVTERGPVPSDDELRSIGVPVLAGGHREEHLDGATLVVTSPGVPESAEVLGWARARSLPIWSELELGARVCRAHYVGITGTNGKTTTTEMVAAAMRAAGLDAVACGNIGLPFSLAARASHDALAVEASSFQLLFQESFHPKVSVLLNLADDHLDWHGSLEAYGEAKARIYRRQTPNEVHVGMLDDEGAAAISRLAPCRLVWSTTFPPAEGQVGYEGRELVSRLGARGVRLGAPMSMAAGFRADAAAASAAALCFGLEPRDVATGVGAVSPLPHRGDVVATVRGVRFVDDSKATNPHAALAAMEGLERVVLIAGGRAKGVDLSPLSRATGRLAAVVTLGEARNELHRVFDGRVPVHDADSVEEAARMALGLAQGEATVLLAPACASQDMFADYRERGDRFAAAASRLREEEGAARGQS
jgi:UDP-N-acetylmuramoylalanine--D-glutamate ligase